MHVTCARHFPHNIDQCGKMHVIKWNAFHPNMLQFKPTRTQQIVYGTPFRETRPTTNINMLQKRAISSRNELIMLH